MPNESIQVPSTHTIRRLGAPGCLPVWVLSVVSDAISDDKLSDHGRPRQTNACAGLLYPFLRCPAANQHRTRAAACPAVWSCEAGHPNPELREGSAAQGASKAIGRIVTITTLPRCRAAPTRRLGRGKQRLVLVRRPKNLSVASVCVPKVAETGSPYGESDRACSCNTRFADADCQRPNPCPV